MEERCDLTTPEGFRSADSGGEEFPPREQEGGKGHSFACQ